MKLKSIFDGIENKEKDKIIKSLESDVMIFNKNKTIISNDISEKLIGIILNGTANVEKYDYNGNRSIIEKLDNNSLFGNIFFRVGSEISVVATSECEVLLFEYNTFIKKVKNKVFINNFFKIYTEKILNLNIRIEILSKRTIREKLLEFFSIISNNSKKYFTIPFSYTELADYLFVDRSSMMREIKNMKYEGIIKANGKKVKILN